MPQWFLKLWIAAQELVGTTANATSGGSADVSYVTTNVAGAGKFLASKNNADAFPAINGLALDGIDIQTQRTAGKGALSRYDIVIGRTSGVAGTAKVASGANVIIGNNTTFNSVSTADGNNTIVGSGSSLNRSGTSHTDSGSSVLIGHANAVSGSGGRNTLVGPGNVLQISGLNTNFTHTGSSMFGDGNVAAIGGNSNNLAVYGSINGFNGIATSVNMFGTEMIVGDAATNTEAYTGCTFIGNLLQHYGGLDGTTVIGNGVGGIQALITLKSGATINTSLVTLGSKAGAGTEALLGVTDGANVAFQYAHADLGHVFLVSAASVTIPDNTSLVTFTGTTNTAIIFPANPIEKQKLVVTFDGAQTPTWSAGAGKTLRNGPGNSVPVQAGQSFEFIFNKAANGAVANAWYRVR